MKNKHCEKYLDNHHGYGYIQSDVRGYVMKCVCFYLTALLLVWASSGALAQETDSEQRALICDDLLQELSQPLPAPDPSERDTHGFLEPLYTMEQTKLSLMAVFGFSLTLMIRILYQMHLKALSIQINTHASTLHYHSRKTVGWIRRNRKARPESILNIRHALHSSLRRSFTTIEQFHYNTLSEGHPTYPRSHRRFAHSPSY